MQLLLEAVAECAEVFGVLRVLGVACLRCFFLQFFQLAVPDFFQAFFAGCDVHGQFLEVGQVEVVHLVEGRDVLEQLDLMILENLYDVVDGRLGPVVFCFHGDQFVALLLEEFEEAFVLFFDIEIFQLGDQSGYEFADFAHIFVLDVIKGKI